MLDTETASEYLAKYELTPGDTVYTILRSVSRSGMSRRVDVVVMSTDHDGKPYPARITHLVAAVLGNSSDPDRGMRVNGCGMDMGFHVVYSLSSKLFGGDGYALNHRWL